jgi:hypothetical protein
MDQENEATPFNGNELMDLLRGLERGRSPIRSNIVGLRNLAMGSP